MMPIRNLVLAALGLALLAGFGISYDLRTSQRRAATASSSEPLERIARAESSGRTLAARQADEKRGAAQTAAPGPALDLRQKALTSLNDADLLTPGALRDLQTAFAALSPSERNELIQQAVAAEDDAQQREVGFWLGRRYNDPGLIATWKGVLYAEGEASYQREIENLLAVAALGELALQHREARSILYDLVTHKNAPKTETRATRRVAAEALIAAQPQAILRLSAALNAKDPFRDVIKQIVAEATHGN